jgi:hypothetical protein
MTNDRFDAYRRAALKAVDFQLGFQRPDGGYIWPGYANDAYHKQAYSWQLAGHVDAAHRLLDWVKRDTLQPDGQLANYNGDIYKHAWLCQGAQRLGRFDLSYPVMKFLLSCQAPCGGFPHFAADELTRSLATSWAGIAALYLGHLEVAQRAARCCMRMLDAQPRPDRFYFQVTRDGRLVTEQENPAAQFIDIAQTKQCYWEVGFAMLLMCRMHQATGERSYVDYAGRFLDFKLRCADDAFAYWGSGKSALASAIYFTLTGDQRARDAACRFCAFVVQTQCPEGGFRYADEPDELLYYVDHAACFSVWVLETLAALGAAET